MADLGHNAGYDYFAVAAVDSADAAVVVAVADGDGDHDDNYAADDNNCHL